MKKTDISDSYKASIATHIIVLIILISCGIIIPILLWGYFSKYSIVIDIILLIFIEGLCILCIISQLKGIVSLFKDYKAYKNKNYISILGKVIKFREHRNIETNGQINNMPVVINIETNEEVTLKVNDFISVGETYRFNYLKNSKIAEVVGLISTTDNKN